MQYTKSELAKLIETVETEFSGFLAKSETAASAVAPLAKAEDAKPEEKKEEKPSEKKDEKPNKEEKPPQEHEDKAEEKRGEKKPDATPEHKEEEAPKGEAEPHAPAAAEGQEAGQEHGYDEEDMAHMHKMYASMSKAELKAHHDCIMKCGMMAQSEEANMAKSETVQATEIKVEPVQSQPETALLKSELESTKAQNEELKKNLEGVKEFLTALVKQVKGVPQGKAVTTLDAVTKSEPTQETKELSKVEIKTILSEKAADPNLKKSDREAINNYYLNGANLNTISHLLK